MELLVDAPRRAFVPGDDSHGRATQQPALTIWDGRDANMIGAQSAFARGAQNNRDARRGQYAPAAVPAPA
ncbi:class I fructose-bisphosphate aldolase [Mycolicibacterium sphagni]|uniref:class I fructose-bisphosphate aldolase n=1 Tax=Mycolicibacterium sphagni TaxID=1786 RepID=UPI0013FDE25F|nr:fructose-bisphosphate aldolase [Mycolicibacterium sphagni]